MASQFKYRLAAIAALCWISGCLTSKGDDLLSRQSIPPSWRTEAELNDVFFLDNAIGVAAGEHGTILRTVDGGQTWAECATLRPVSQHPNGQSNFMRRELAAIREQTNSGGTAKANETVRDPGSGRLNSVYFADAKNGWAIGGYDIPYLDRSRAVVLSTGDGGESWHPRKNLMAPRLVKAEFQNGFSGWAFGAGGHLYKTGVLLTSDAGNSWSSQTAGAFQSWIDGQVTADGFVAIDSNGTLRVSRSGRLEPAIVSMRPLQFIRRLRMIDQRTGWAVGDGGSVLQTKDGGVSWTVALQLDQHVELRHFDFNTLCVKESRVWFAGSPGTYVFSYDFDTKQLLRHRTPTAAAINRLCFTDSQHGWAVGQMGTILSTSNRGETWQLQRGGDAELSMFVVDWGWNQPQLEAIAKYGGEEGLKTLVARISLTSTDQVSDYRLAQSISQVGGLGLITCKSIANVDANGQSSIDWDRVHSQLVKWIRQHRPRMIVSEATTARLDSGEIVDLQLVLDRAIKSAGRLDQLSDQLVGVALEPWQVERLLLAQPKGGQWPIPDNMFLTRTGTLLGDQVAISRALLGDSLTKLMPGGFQVVHFISSASHDQNGFLSGVDHSGRRMPVRASSHSSRGNMQEIKAAMGKTEKMIGLLTKYKQILTSGDQIVWQQSISQWIESADEANAGVWLAQLAEAYIAAGRLDLAAMTLEQLLARVPNHGLAPAATIWLAHHASSREVEIAMDPAIHDWTPQPGTPKIENVQPAAYESSVKMIERDGIKQLVWVPTGARENPIAQVDFQAELPADEAGLRADQKIEMQRFWQQASKQIGRTKQRDPEFGAMPQLKWLEAHAVNYSVSWVAAQSQYSQLAVSGDAGPEIQRAALRELKLHPDKNELPETVLQCLVASSRPKLDGRLDDQAWAAAIAAGNTVHIGLIPPTAAQRSLTDALVFTYDDQFLFIAIRCNKLDGFVYRDATQSRNRDARMDDQDRVRLYFDVDRDGYWPLSLAVDNRGAVADGCGPSPAWNPQWFVARGMDDASWIVETAIPWSQFGSGRPQAGDIWTLGASRQTGWSRSNLWSSPSPIDDSQLRMPSLKMSMSAADFWTLRFE